MPVMEYLERNAELYGDEVALIELNPAEPDSRRTPHRRNRRAEGGMLQPDGSACGRL